MPRHGYERKTLHKKAPRTAFKPGDPRINRKGRVKGVPNKFTRDIKEALLTAFNKVGAEKYLETSAKKDRRSFLSLIGKLLPTQLTGKDDGPINILVERAQGGLSNLSDKELAQLQTLLAKAGLKGDQG